MTTGSEEERPRYKHIRERRNDFAYIYVKLQMYDVRSFGPLPFFVSLPLPFVA